MNSIGFNIKRIRTQKGYSQEFMASQLDISQASYARIESQEIKLSVDRLQKIAEILETDIFAFLDSSKLTIQNQTNNDTLENEIEYLKTEIEFLRTIIKTNNR
jgi:transcriptional regulator with XRE-family HTH domain